MECRYSIFQLPMLSVIEFFKRLGSQNKEIKLQESMNRINNILCKTDLNLIHRLTYKCINFNDVHLEAHFKFAFVPLWY